MKKFLSLAIFLQALSVVFGLFLRFGISDLPELERQTFVILLNIKEAMLIALYIAWRVTPDSKLR